MYNIVNLILYIAPYIFKNPGVGRISESFVFIWYTGLGFYIFSTAQRKLVLWKYMEHALGIKSNYRISLLPSEVGLSSKLAFCHV